MQDRHDALLAAVRTVSAAVPLDWRRGSVERADLPRFLFAPEDVVVVVVGQDGLVANVAKYLDGQPVLGVDAEPGRNPGVLVTHRAGDAAPLLPAAVAGPVVQERVMVEATTDDGQVLRALNEVYVGHPGHQTARYRLTVPGGQSERQASSGVLVGTGTGATGWCGSVARERAGSPVLPTPTQRRLAWFVREAWASPGTGTCATGGEVTDRPLRIDVESDRLVAFGDGIEADALELGWGRRLEVLAARRTLRLVV